MNSKGLDFRKKEVINIKDGRRLGFVQDVTADLKTGTIKEIIVPGDNKLFGLFSNSEDIVIPWNAIKCISDEIILVEI
ncbi:MAG: YlmC/YmxH family sporulation protein [Clostridia bacterium]|nr:YlmC/YmxH family sporulation protein [Clostridia bacterium]